MKRYAILFILVWTLKHFALSDYQAMARFMASLEPEIAAAAKIVATKDAVIIFYREER